MRLSTFFRKHAVKNGTVLQLDPNVLDQIAGLKLPFTAKNYYSFCDKYLDDDAHEALFVDGEDKYFREIATDYETLRYLQFAGQLSGAAPVLADIGCGIGNVVHFAGKLGFEAFGYELNVFLAPVHKKIKADIIYGDILKTDLLRLKKADVVYIYRPINDDKLMNRLFSLVYMHTKKDVLIFYNYPHSRNIKKYMSIGLGAYDDMILLLKQP